MAQPPYRTVPILDQTEETKDLVSLPWYRFFQQETSATDISGLEAQIAAAAALAQEAQATASTALSEVGTAQSDADSALELAALAIAEAGNETPGPPGARGLQGLPGFDGLDGEDGWAGPPGLNGSPGAQGLMGFPGFDGEDGQDGIPGQAGAAGATGATGPAGSAGAQGPAGFDGDDADGAPLTPPMDANTAPIWTLAHKWTVGGIASVPALSITGAPFTGGNGTTTTPLVFVGNGATAVTGWSTSGTELGFNAPSGFGGNFLDFWKNNSHVAFMDNAGNFETSGAVWGSAGLTGFGSAALTTNGLTVGSTLGMGFASSNNLNLALDTLFTRKGAANIQHGAADAAAPVAQTISFQSVVAGTSNTAGVNTTIKASIGTGTGAGGNINFAVAPAGTTGSTQNSTVTALSIVNSGPIVLSQGFTVATLPASPGTGARAYVTDALTPSFLTAVVGGGSTVAPVFYNGSAWVGG